tara:strand:- start:584 stop:793 length:210 start_codon:yes stop_codon:yes gene_type:complete
MMHIEDLEALGFKQMHRVQVKAVLDFVQDAIHLAAMTDDPEILADVEQTADELIRLFGGTGVTVTIETD